MRHSPILHIWVSGIDGIAVFIDAIMMVSGREKFIVVAVMTARMTRDAIQNCLSIHQIPDIPLQSLKLILCAHCPDS